MESALCRMGGWIVVSVFCSVGGGIGGRGLVLAPNPVGVLLGESVPNLVGG